MSNYVTIVVRIPESNPEKQQVSKAIEALEPFTTAKSLQDEMTVLDMIEKHPNFDESIADEARVQVANMDKQSENSEEDTGAVEEWKAAMDREKA